MSEYFESFPSIVYNGQNVRDITRRARLIQKLKDNPLLFLPYTVKENERAEDIAYYYYGSTEYTWLVYIANNVLDPYHDWPLSQDNFDQYLIQKYEDISGRKGYEVLDWLRNETITDNILYYYKELDEDTDTIIPQQIFSDLIEQPDIEQIDYDNELVVIDGIQYRLVKE